MKNLKNQTSELLSRVKVLFMKILPHLIVLVIILSISWYIVNRSIHKAEDEAIKYEQYKEGQDELFEGYQIIMDSMQSANYTLEQNLMELEKKLDSITKKQRGINESYQEEMNIISNATLPEHAVWFYTKLDSIRQYYRK